MDLAIDERPAGALLSNLDVIYRRLQDAMVDTGDRTVLSWSEAAAMAADQSIEQAATGVLSNLDRVVGGAAPVSLGTLLDVVEAGRLAELARPLFPTATRRELADRFAARGSTDGLRSDGESSPSDTQTLMAWY